VAKVLEFPLPLSGTKSLELPAGWEHSVNVGGSEDGLVLIVAADLDWARSRPDRSNPENVTFRVTGSGVEVDGLYVGSGWHNGGWWHVFVMES
jgi:hypothetical protein